MLLNAQKGFRGKKVDLEKIEPLTTVAEIIQARTEVLQVTIEDSIIDYLLALVQKTRKHPDLFLGASPRAAVAWLQTSKAQAWLSDRDYVTPDDIKMVASALLRHRLILKPEAQLDGVQIEDVITSLLKQVPVPR